MKRWLERIASSRTLMFLALLGIGGGAALLAFADPLASGVVRILDRDSIAIMPSPPPVRPSPTWAPMPTRAFSVSPVTLNTDDALTDFNLALLRADFEDAYEIWERAPSPSAPKRVAWYQSGARLFLGLREFDQARALLLSAILLAPTNSESWFLLHVVSREMQDWSTADYALDVALSLDPQRADDLFLSRWLSAVETNDTERMVTLAESFVVRHPRDPLQAYFRAKALAASGEAVEAAHHLIEAIEGEPNAPMILWYALGEAYLKLGAYHEARSALEVAADLFYRGETTATQLESPFLTNLNINLAKAYLGTGACSNAEAVFRRLAASDAGAGGASKFDAWIELAVRCQTPTPTLTPWIPKQIGTVTPLPP